MPNNQHADAGPIVLRFPRGVLGFQGVTCGALERGIGQVMALHLGAGRSLPVVVPWDVNPGFGFRFDDCDTADLGDPTDWTIVCTVRLPKPGRIHFTMNQFSPFVVNEEENISVQLINQAPGYSTRDGFTLAVSA